MVGCCVKSRRISDLEAELGEAARLMDDNDDDAAEVLSAGVLRGDGLTAGQLLSMGGTLISLGEELMEYALQHGAG